MTLLLSMPHLNVPPTEHTFTLGLTKQEASELSHMQVFSYERELGLSTREKFHMIAKVIHFLRKKNIFVLFTQRIIDDKKPWEREPGEEWRNLPVAELKGNHIYVNPRNLDFLGVFLSIGHIYGHLVQRMEKEKYDPITDFLEIPKPMDLEHHLSVYKERYGNDYKEDFVNFEKEAFRYAKFTFQEAGVKWSSIMDYAMNVYIEADFNELWDWVVDHPNKDAVQFTEEFQRLWDERKGTYVPLSAKPINIHVVPDPEGSLIVVRNNVDSRLFI